MRRSLVTVGSPIRGVVITGVGQDVGVVGLDMPHGEVRASDSTAPPVAACPGYSSWLLQADHAPLVTYPILAVGATPGYLPPSWQLSMFLPLQFPQGPGQLLWHVAAGGCIYFMVWPLYSSW